MVGKCRLCCEERELCKQSHIIPNFMYQDLFDGKNRMQVIKSRAGTIKQGGYRQTGEFDSYILCSPCDNEKLGRLDRYASLILYDGHPKILQNRTSSKGMNYTYCAEVDYAQFKLFLLSLLFRASISNRPLFREVQLGPHEERIRQMLFNGDPGDQLQYPCLIMTYLHLRDYPGKVIAQPSWSMGGGRHVYTFLISGMIYLFFISQDVIPPESKDFFLNPKGEIKIIHLTPQLARKALGSMIDIKLKWVTITAASPPVRRAVGLHMN